MRSSSTILNPFACSVLSAAAAAAEEAALRAWAIAAVACCTDARRIEHRYLLRAPAAPLLCSLVAVPFRQLPALPPDTCERARPWK